MADLFSSPGGFPSLATVILFISSDVTIAPQSFALQTIQLHLAKSISFVQTGEYPAGVPGRTRILPLQRNLGAVSFSKPKDGADPSQPKASPSCNFTRCSSLVQGAGWGVGVLVLHFFPFIL